MVTFAGNEFLSFYTDYVGGTNRFIVIGVQQWGYCPYTEDNNAKITLPITYAIKHYIAVSSAEDTYGGSINITGIWELTLTDFVLAKSAHARSAFWISLGCQQQWGHKDNSTSIVTFNLSFPTTCFIALVETLNDGTVNSHLRVSGATNVGFSTWDSATNRPYSVQNYWLALGI